MNNGIWGAIGQIGDDLILSADESCVKEYFGQKKRRVWMKYASLAACFALIIGVIFASPLILAHLKLTNAEGESVDVPPTKTGEYPIEYISADGDWPHYSTVGEIAGASSEIYSGKVTGISFEIIDDVTGKADNSPDSESARSLYTLYSVEVFDSYKGEKVSEKVICVFGGMEGYKEKEQYELLRSSGLLEEYHGIPVTDAMHYVSGYVKIGNEYLFCTTRAAGDYDHIINALQFAHRLDSENAKKIILYVK